LGNSGRRPTHDSNPGHGQSAANTNHTPASLPFPTSLPSSTPFPAIFNALQTPGTQSLPSYSTATPSQRQTPSQTTSSLYPPGPTSVSSPGLPPEPYATTRPIDTQSFTSHEFDNGFYATNSANTPIYINPQLLQAPQVPHQPPIAFQPPSGYYVPGTLLSATNPSPLERNSTVVFPPSNPTSVVNSIPFPQAPFHSTDWEGLNDGHRDPSQVSPGVGLCLSSTYLLVNVSHETETHPPLPRSVVLDEGGKSCVRNVGEQKGESEDR
jgi:hypothetical protein